VSRMCWIALSFSFRFATSASTTAAPAGSSTTATTEPASSSASSAASIRAARFLGDDFLLNFIDHFIWDTQILDCVPSDVAFGDSPKSITVTRGANHFAKVDVHKVVAVDEMAVVSFAIFELHQHRMSLGGTEKGQR